MQSSKFQLSAVLANRAWLYLALGWSELLMALSSFDEAQHRLHRLGNKIKKYKNPTWDIYKNKLNDNSKYEILLNKTQFNNLLKNNSIKYKLTDSKKNRNIMIGGGIGSLISMALNMIKPALPKIASTIGLAGLSTGVSHGINKALNKNNIIKLSDKQVNDINKNLDIINKSKIFNKKITLSQNGSGIFSILLPMLASTIIPVLIKKGKGNNSNFFWNKIKIP